MKTRNLLWGLCGALAVLSCSKEAPVTVPETEISVYDPWAVVPLDCPELQGGEPHTVIAGFATRTHLDMNEAGTRASVVWSPNDSFRMFNQLASGGFYSSYYTTAQGGENAVFTGSVNGEVYKLYAIYPDAFAVSRHNVSGQDYTIFGITIPMTQTATAGSVAEGANVSYATPSTKDGHFSFRNLVSLIKFRLSGDIVSSVRSVTFRGMSEIVGDFVIYEPNGEPEILTSLYFTSHNERSTSAVLEGTFLPDTDYYIAIAPCSQSRFSMVFANEDGSESTTLSCSSNMVFNRSDISDFGTIDLGNAFTDDLASQAPVQYKTASAGAPKAVSIVVIPDGYTADELSRFTLEDAPAAMDALFSTEPYKSYAQYFNVWILPVPSNESGANITDGNGNIVTPRDCYFGSKWGADSYNDLSADASLVFSFVSERCPDIKDGSHVIDEVPVLILINDNRYGGMAHNYSNGKTYCQVPLVQGPLNWAFPKYHAVSATATPPNYVETTNAERNEMGRNSGTWWNTVVHEFGGHSFGRLGDEYWGTSYITSTSGISSHNWSVPYALNVSGAFSPTPWDLLLDGGVVKESLTDLDARYGRIGVFQGASNSMFYRWRSEIISCMIDNRFYFSAWQRYLIVQRIRTLAGLTAPLTLEEFLSHDDPTDPLRDTPPTHVIGLSDAIPPRTMPMLPPPVLID